MRRGRTKTRKKLRPSTGGTSQRRIDSLLAADAAWLKAYQQKDPVLCAAFYDEGGAMLAPNRPLLTGKDAIRKFIASSFELENYDIIWHPRQADVSHSGELGYTSGSYEMSFSQRSGKLFFDKGKYLMLWKRQKDGTWKVLFDMSNSDLPHDK